MTLVQFVSLCRPQLFHCEMGRIKSNGQGHHKQQRGLGVCEWDVKASCFNYVVQGEKGLWLKPVTSQPPAGDYGTPEMPNTRVMGGESQGWEVFISTGLRVHEWVNVNYNERPQATNAIHCSMSLGLSTSLDAGPSILDFGNPEPWLITDSPVWGTLLQ